MRTLIFFVFVITMVGLEGCFEPKSQRLLGRWIGRPDSSEVDIPVPADAGPQDDNLPAATRPPGAVSQKTDFELFDFSIELDFLDRRRIRVTMGGNKESVEGTWRTVEAAGDRITIQIAADPTASSSAGSTTLRQYVVRFKSGSPDEFTLQEDGADPLLGRLHFMRASD